MGLSNQAKKAADSQTLGLFLGSGEGLCIHRQQFGVGGVLVHPRLGCSRVVIGPQPLVVNGQLHLEPVCPELEETNHFRSNPKGFVCT